MTNWYTGEAVHIRYEGQEISGTVLLAAGNGRALMIEFDGMLGGQAGTMAVLDDGSGIYISIGTGKPVELSKVVDEGRPITY